MFPKKNICQTDCLCQQYLSLLYYDIRHTNSIATKQTNIAETYGEILYPSVNKLLSSITISTSDVFLDLGAGLGKVVLQVFLKTNVKAAYGIEIIPPLHQKARLAAHRLQHDLPEFYLPDRQLAFFLGNFVTLPLPKANIILIGSPCFGESLLLPLAKIIDACEAVHTVFSLRPMGYFKRLRFKKVIRIECSWDTALCYLYQSC